mgnify:FL=1
MWGKQSTFENIPLRLKSADPEDGCEPYAYKPPKFATGYVANGLEKCPISNMIHNAQAHNAHALFVVNAEDTDINKATVPDHIPGVQIHVLLISKKDGDTLMSTAEAVGLEDIMVTIDFLVERTR